MFIWLLSLQVIRLLSRSLETRADVAFMKILKAGIRLTTCCHASVIDKSCAGMVAMVFIIITNKIFVGGQLNLGGGGYKQAQQNHQRHH